ncbi:MAG: DNA processing protein DprA [Verrucomicrobia subdivision 3 bacterium]|nr:DNA processing protein DprA [Limisphaerales bacterium]MCS1412886.1 DNA processing protein DprA [Limisphaerales bacterium]
MPVPENIIDEVSSILLIDSLATNRHVSSDMTSQEAMIALNMLEKVGPITVRRLLEKFASPEKILAASQQSLLRIPGVGADTAASIARWETQIDLKKELSHCKSFGCHIVTQLDLTYPSALRNIYDPPIVLYVRGSLEERDQTSIALVGSRMTTHYGRETTRKLAYQLGMAGVTVVSGGARGIDSSAHQGALSAKGRTICVLGNGINITYPSENRELFEQVSSNGAVITQFPFNRQADRQTFPIRNRIIAGMTLGTAVVEANVNSGALITANMANDYGRLVFAVPGPIHSPRSKGCHQLIKNGAKLCESVDDILTEFEYLFPAANPLEQSASAIPLSDSEQTLYDMIRQEDIHVDELVRMSGLTISTVSVALLQLEMKRLIKQRPGNHYCASTEFNP